MFYILYMLYSIYNIYYVIYSIYNMYYKNIGMYFYMWYIYFCNIKLKLTSN